MTFSFEKYHGAGNDFILVDGRLLPELPSTEMIARLCHRHFGIGADGFIALYPEGTDIVGMRYFNADGRESTMCGNGGRCSAAWVFRNLEGRNVLTINASDGMHKAEVLFRKNHLFEISLDMIDCSLPAEALDGFFIDTGSPHHISYVQDLKSLDVRSVGEEIRNSPAYSPEGANVNFVEEHEAGLKVRTYERGVEDETLACGTGAVAVALTQSWREGEEGDGMKEIIMPGGELRVRYSRFPKGFRKVRLQGPAEFVYFGEINW